MAGFAGWLDGRYICVNDLHNLYTPAPPALSFRRWWSLCGAVRSFLLLDEGIRHDWNHSRDIARCAA